MSTLQKLLNLGLVDIGSDDSRFEKMTAAATALVAKLKENPSLLIPTTLIAIDSEVDENEPIFSFVEDLVIAEWKTLRNTHVNRPRALLRSIIIDAVSTVVDESPEIAGVIWHTAVSPLKHGQTRLGKEGSLVEELVQRAGMAAEQAAVVHAGMTEQDFKKRRRMKTSTNISAFKLQSEITDNELVTDIARSAGPQDPQGRELSDSNPHWPTQGQPWSQQFTPLMTAALVKAVNLGTERLADVLSENLSAYLAALEQRLSEQVHRAAAIQNEVTQSQQAGRMRLDVLWWSEALYSPSLARGYRELHLVVAAVAMALDLSRIVPALAPASVTYVLGESVASLSPHSFEGATQPLESLLTVLAEDKTDFGEQLQNTTSHQGRLQLFDLVAEAAGGTSVAAEAVHSRAGLRLRTAALHCGVCNVGLPRSPSPSACRGPPMTQRCRHESCFPDTTCALWAPGPRRLRALDCRGRSRRGANGSRVEQVVSDIPWNGYALGMSDLAILGGRGRPIVVGLIGPPDAGKTSLLAFLYMWLLDKGELPGWVFAGSWTLGGWESVVRYSRWTGEPPPSFPPHTSSTGRVPGLLHLCLRNGTGALRDVFFTDAPGEWFTQWAKSPEDESAAGARWVFQHADVLILLADSHALAASETLPQARRALRDLVERVGAVGRISRWASHGQRLISTCRNRYGSRWNDPECNLCRTARSGRQRSVHLQPSPSV